MNDDKSIESSYMIPVESIQKFLFKSLRFFVPTGTFTTYWGEPRGTHL